MNILEEKFLFFKILNLRKSKIKIEKNLIVNYNINLIV
jgi:hypothetical protein